jgi:hypothetical protein
MTKPDKEDPKNTDEDKSKADISEEEFTKRLERLLKTPKYVESEIDVLGLTLKSMGKLTELSNMSKNALIQFFQNDFLECKSLLEYIYIEHPNDKENILKYVEQFDSLNDTMILEKCGKAIKSGIVGVHQQALYLIALRSEMLKRFKYSPIVIGNNGLIKVSLDEK